MRILDLGKTYETVVGLLSAEDAFAFLKKRKVGVRRALQMLRTKQVRGYLRDLEALEVLRQEMRVVRDLPAAHATLKSVMGDVEGRAEARLKAAMLVLEKAAAKRGEEKGEVKRGRPRKVSEEEARVMMEALARNRAEVRRERMMRGEGGMLNAEL